MTRLSLPDDNWAELAHPRKVSERKRRRYERGYFELNEMTRDLPRNPDNPQAPDEKFFGAEHKDQIDRIEDLLILCLVKEWSYGEVSDEALAELPSDAYRALKAECEKYRSDLMPDFSPDPDPKAPTAPSTPQVTP